MLSSYFNNGKLFGIISVLFYCDSICLTFVKLQFTFFKLVNKIEKESFMKTLHFKVNFHSERPPSQNNQETSTYFNVLELISSKGVIL